VRGCCAVVVLVLYKNQIPYFLWARDHDNKKKEKK
jgi:hypothetical protein